MSADADTVREALTLAATLPFSVPEARFAELQRLDALTMGDAPALAALARLEAAAAQRDTLAEAAKLIRALEQAGGNEWWEAHARLYLALDEVERSR